MDAVYHARSSARKWGGKPEEFVHIHAWFDESSEHINDLRHRLMRHHSQGIAECVKRFGRMLTLSNGRQVPIKKIGEQHVQEDLGYIPTLADWVKAVRLQPWMMRRGRMRVVL